jgi:hypothetical protein
MSAVVGSLFVRPANGLAAFSLHGDRNSRHEKCAESATLVVLRFDWAITRPVIP